MFNALSCGFSPSFTLRYANSSSMQFKRENIVHAHSILPPSRPPTCTSLALMVCFLPGERYTPSMTIRVIQKHEPQTPSRPNRLLIYRSNLLPKINLLIKLINTGQDLGLIAPPHPTAESLGSFFGSSTERPKVYTVCAWCQEFTFEMGNDIFTAPMQSTE